MGARTTVRVKKHRARSQGAWSGAAWLAQRRQQLGAAVAARKLCPSGKPRRLTALDKGPNIAAWTPKHEAGVQHQKE